MKSIERFERLKNWCEGNSQYTKEKEMDEDFNEIKNSLEALEIIKEKDVKINVLKNYETLEEYNDHVFKDEELTEEEFDLLKKELEK